MGPCSRKCQDQDSNPHSAAHKHQSLSPVRLTTQQQHSTLFIKVVVFFFSRANQTINFKLCLVYTLMTDAIYAGRGPRSDGFVWWFSANHKASTLRSQNGLVMGFL